MFGFDISNQRIADLNNFIDKTLELSHVLSELIEIKNNIVYCDNLQNISDCNIYIITVPTPIDKYNKPDLSPLINTSQSVGSILSKDDIVIYESTVYPGVTEEVCIPELEKFSKMKFNQDFFVGYSPERLNPGDKSKPISKILKVTSGSTPEIAKTVDDLYKSIISAGTFLASSIKVAEASKVIENTQRDVNIALMNELTLIFNYMGIDTNEVIEAASTKWNFVKLKPGLVGGHCIGVDPYYLTFKAEELGYKPNLILNARQINNGMGKYIAEQTVKTMISFDKKIKDSNILILGLTFKEDCPDIRNTKVVDIIEELKYYGCNVSVYDPWVEISDSKKSYKHGLIKDPFKSKKKYDAAIIAVAHSKFKQIKNSDFDKILNKKQIIIDIKGIEKMRTGHCKNE